MSIALIIVGVYFLTIVAYLCMEVSDLKEEKEVVTVEDVVKSCEFFYFVPVYNTIIFISVFIGYIIWEKCSLGSLCGWIWNKIKDIKL